VELEILDKMPLLEWLANNYKTFGKLLSNIIFNFFRLYYLAKF